LTRSHDFQDQDRMMDENIERLKQQFPLLDYLRSRQWSARRAGHQQEFVGLCPFHRETKPSFYVNAAKNLFYCHGCGRGGDLIRWIQLSLGLSFRESVEHLKRELGQVANPPAELLEQTTAFYQCQLHRHVEAAHYLAQRGLRDPDLIQQLRIGYAPGGNLRRHLATLGYSLDVLLQAGLINDQGRDTFCRRVVFPCSQQGRVINLYGRSIGKAFPHRFLPRSKGGLFAWESVNQDSAVILVEGLFDLAVLWQAGFRNTTCAFGTHLTPAQFSQLCDRRGRQLYIAFDCDANHAGQQSAAALAQRLKGAGPKVYIVELPDGHDPNSYFVAGATADDFACCLDRAHSRHL
jgi:DNA primase